MDRAFQVFATALRFQGKGLDLETDLVFCILGTYTWRSFKEKHEKHSWCPPQEGLTTFFCVFFNHSEIQCFPVILVFQ